MIVLDTETTGLDPEKNSLLSIGVLEFENPENQFYGECRIWDGAEVSPAALEVNGFSDEEITDPEKQSLCELMEAFLSWAADCDNKMIAGHNAAFDLQFLVASAERCGLDSNLFHKRIIDTHSLAWMHLVQSREEVPAENGHSSLSSDFIFTYAGITEERGEHNALEDAKLTAEAISRLSYDKQLLEEYEQFPIPWNEQ